MSTSLSALSDDELRALVRGYARDEPYISEAYRRHAVLRVLSSLYDACMAADRDEWYRTHEFDITELAPWPDSSGTAVVREIYEQTLRAWLDGEPGVTELWSVAQVAEHYGVSESRARHILADAGIGRITGYPTELVRAIHRPGQGARSDLRGATLQERPMWCATSSRPPSGG